MFPPSLLSSFLGATAVATLSAVLTVAQNASVQWGPCDPSIATNPVLSCGFFDVPLDYNDTSVGTATLALAKVNATVEPHLGTVFFNPGGPGDSGISLVAAFSGYLLNFTGGHYDFVTWDPRGVGASKPGDVQCFDSLAEYNTLFNGTAQLNGIEMTGNFTNPEDLRALFSQADSLQKKYEESVRLCIERNGDILKYLGTSATVRDMVALADALDGPGAPVNYYGISYGTFLGNVFLNMFPERVGRVIIDGVVNPHLWSQEPLSLAWEMFYANADDVYRGFITGCALSGPTGCPISTQPGQDPSEVNDILQGVLKTAHDTALANASALITSGQIRGALLSQMYTPIAWSAEASVWPELLELVQASASGAPTNLSANDVLSQFGNAAPAPAPAPPSFSTPAIACADSLVPPGTTNMTDVFNAIVDSARDVSHIVSAAFPISLFACSFWPVRAVERYAGPFNNTALANKILVLGNTYDPVTPFKFAQGVAESFGEQAALVRFDAFGHSTFGEFSSPCIFNITSAYMTNGTLPDGQDTVCEAREDLDLFPGANTQAILARLPSIGF